MQFRLRTFMLVIAVGSVVAWLLSHWLTVRQGQFYSASGTTLEGHGYKVELMLRQTAFYQERFANAVIFPEGYVGLTRGGLERIQPDGKGLEIYPNGIFYRGKLVGGDGNKPIAIILGNGEIHSIALSSEEMRSLFQTTPRNIIESGVWQEEVEAVVDELLSQPKTDLHGKR